MRIITCLSTYVVTRQLSSRELQETRAWLAEGWLAARRKHVTMHGRVKRRRSGIKFNTFRSLFSLQLDFLVTTKQQCRGISWRGTKAYSRKTDQNSFWQIAESTSFATC